MKYEKEVDYIIKKIFSSIDQFDENSEDDYNELLQMLESYGVTKDILSEQLEEGVKNGHSIETQIEMLENFVIPTFTKDAKLD